MLNFKFKTMKNVILVLVLAFCSMGAANAVVSDNGGMFNINGAKFCNNNYGLRIKNYGGIHPGIVKNSRFRDGKLLPPGTVPPITGIYLSDVRYFTVGNNNSFTDGNVASLMMIPESARMPTNESMLICMPWMSGQHIVQVFC